MKTFFAAPPISRQQRIPNPTWSDDGRKADDRLGNAADPALAKFDGPLQEVDDPMKEVDGPSCI